MLVEEEYNNYAWCQRCIKGIYDEARKKRTALNEIKSFDEIEDCNHIGEAAILLVGASEEWLQNGIVCANAKNIHPIALSNRRQKSKCGPVSSVMMDISDSMRMAIAYLQSLGRDKLALYGINPFSTSDPWRMDVFRNIMGESGTVYQNTGMMEKVFEDFFADLGKYNGVICASDYASVSLMKHLRARGVEPLDKLYIVSYGNMFLSRMFSPSISSISDDYESFGKAALSIYKLIEKGTFISSVNIFLHSKLYVRETTGFAPYISTNTVQAEDAFQQQDNLFFKDREISEMAKLEMLLNQCDETGFAVLHCLMQSHTYTTIAEKCYISETAVKYRIKNMQKICGVASREGLIAFLREYF